MGGKLQLQKDIALYGMRIAALVQVKFNGLRTIGG
jgi:hypothetical protein